MLIGDLAAQLRTDGTPAPGDQDLPAAQIPGDGLIIQLDRFPAEQVFDRHGAELGRVNRHAGHFKDRGQGPAPHLYPVAFRDQALHDFPAGGRHGQDHQFGVHCRNDLTKIVGAAHHPDAVHFPVLFERIIINKCEDLIFRAVQQVPGQHLARSSGPDDNRSLPFPGPQIEAIVLVPPVGNARHAEPGDQQQRIEEEHGARHPVQAIEDRVDNHYQQDSQARPP